MTVNYSKLKKTVLGFGVMACIAGYGTYAVAQETAPPAPPAPQSDVNAVSINQETIDKFAQAYKSVMSLQQELTADLQSVDNNEEAQKLQMGAQERMIGAVQDAGLTIDQYNTVVMEMENNPQLAQRVLDKVK